MKISKINLDRRERALQKFSDARRDVSNPAAQDLIDHRKIHKLSRAYPLSILVRDQLRVRPSDKDKMKQALEMAIKSSPRMVCLEGYMGKYKELFPEDEQRIKYLYEVLIGRFIQRGSDDSSDKCWAFYMAEIFINEYEKMSLSDEEKEKIKKYKKLIGKEEYRPGFTIFRVNLDGLYDSTVPGQVFEGNFINPDSIRPGFLHVK